MATYSWGIDPAKVKLTAKAFQLQNSTYRLVQGMPAAQRRVKTTVVGIQSLRYGFRFFFPSGGKVPGSPIPTSGQVAPRPV